MNWLTNYVRPKIRKLVPQKDIPDNLWVGCPHCKKMIFHKELEDNCQICPNCAYHFRLAPLKRLGLLFDDAEYTLIQLPETKVDPLEFSDLKKYSDRLKEAKKKTKQSDAVVVAQGLIGTHPSIVVVFDFAFMGGSMGTAVGEAIITASNLAILQESALIIVSASGGARMQEGILSLMQMPRTTLAIRQLKDKRLPYVTVLTNPTAGGVTASFAMLGDITLAEPDAMIAFAGRRVIEQTVREILPENFQTSEYLMDHGMVDSVLDRRQIKAEISRILDLLMTKKAPL